MKRIIYFLVFIMFSITAFAIEKDINLNDEISINTVNDFIKLCESLISHEKNDNVLRKKASCLSYTQGLLQGYRATMSIAAEYQFAEHSNKSREKIANELNQDELMHDKIEKMMHDKYFVCQGGNYTIDIALNLYKHVTSSKFSNRSAFAGYTLMNELSKLYPCKFNLQ